MENQNDLLNWISTSTYDLGNLNQCVHSSWATGFLLRMSAFISSGYDVVSSFVHGHLLETSQMV